jgi:hypothetical protein
MRASATNKRDHRGGRSPTKDQRASRLLGICTLVALLAVTQMSCSTLRRRWKRQPSPEAVAAAKARRPLQRLGIVTLVNEAERFVLIDSGAQPTPLEGVRLRSYSGPQVSGELRTSAVRRRPFVVADIIEGTPRTGDEIYEVPPGT